MTWQALAAGWRDDEPAAAAIYCDPEIILEDIEDHGFRWRRERELTRPSLDHDAAILLLAAMLGVLVGVVLAVLVGP